jgi:hypothetical protein
MVDLCAARNLAVTNIEARPNRAENDQVWEIPGDFSDRFAEYLTDTVGVLWGETFGRWHAVAWDGIEKKVYDPQETIKSISNLRLKAYLKVDRILGLD